MQAAAAERELDADWKKLDVVLVSSPVAMRNQSVQRRR